LNTIGDNDTASGAAALRSNTTGTLNTAIGIQADVSAGNLTNATAIGAQGLVNASNKIRLGNTLVTVIEGQVAFTFPSDKTQKENFQPVDGKEVLGKIRGFELSSWKLHWPQS
jgi:trimeric autotransporter adhesin